jgi:8-oxo-dGTP diphosphatase
MKIFCNLCFLIQEDQVLLIYKKRGFGKNKWNGPGGKKKVHETHEAATIREIKEEVNLQIHSLEKVGILDFFFIKPTKEQIQVHVYTSHHFHGIIQESEEAKPRWFKFTDIPFDQMWSDDKYWLPAVLSGQSVRGHFIFDQNNQLLNYHLRIYSRKKSF